MNPTRSILAALTTITIVVASPSAFADGPLANISSAHAGSGSGSTAREVTNPGSTAPGTASTAPSSPARAPGIIGEAEQWVQAVMAGPYGASDPTARTASATAARAEAAEAPQPAAAETPVFDLAPTASLVARDWRGSMKLVGDRTMLVDDLRPAANSRMVVGRLSTAEARLTTFAQVGAGEWRVDTAMFPNARSYSETAGQLGGGFELRLPAKLRVSGEAQYTVLSRNLTYAADEVAPLIAAFVFALDGKF